MCYCGHRHTAEPKVSESGATSDEENEEGDFTVYECPGLAPVCITFSLVFLPLTTFSYPPYHPSGLSFCHTTCRTV